MWGEYSKKGPLHPTLGVSSVLVRKFSPGRRKWGRGDMGGGSVTNIPLA